MRTTLITTLLLLSLATNVTTATVSMPPEPYDVVVVGGTPAGVAAAIAAGRLGMRVMLVEQSPVLGGVLSSGVNRLDDYVVQANSGVMEEFRQRVMKYHLTSLANDPVVARDVKDPSRWSVAEGRGWEPKTAARIFAEMVAEVPSVIIKFREVPTGVKMKGDRVVAVITRDRDNQGRLGAEHRYDGTIIVDATYEGDVAAFAGAPFRIG
ncbi:MAG TPA: FAD-dependent oxidoreductase, partial [Chryseolinea sp.]|nr:FAD-dependent oxidoreductase [Chryseolinea sp.]